MKAAGRPTGFYCKSRPVLYSPSKQLAYVKTPKGASLAIQDLFQKQFPDYRWAEAHEELPASTLVFTFVREPLKRLMSAYAEIDVAYALRASPEAHSAMRTVFDKVKRTPGVRETPRVLAFLDDLMDHRFGGDDREHWMPTHAYSQLNFICQHRVDYIGHLENQQGDWEAIQQLAKIPAKERTPFPHAHDSSQLKTNATNASATVCNRACQFKAADQKAPLTPQLMQRLCDIFASDFLCLGYPMPPVCAWPTSAWDAGAINGTLPLASSARSSAPVYVMPHLDANAAWRLARESASYRNTLFVVPSAVENRTTAYRLKRAENHSFAVATSGDARLLRDYDRFGWYWLSAHETGNGLEAAVAASSGEHQPLAPLAVAMPVRRVEGGGLAESSSAVRLGVDRALSEAQQLLLLHRYDRVVVAGEGLVRDGEGSGGSGNGNGLAKHVVDAIGKRLVDPLATAAAPPRQGGSWEPRTNASAPHKHFLPG